MFRSAARAVAAVAVAACALAACANLERATTMDTTGQDFEQLWDYSKPADSEARFRAELARHPPGTEAHAQLLTQIARTHSLRRNFDQAHQLLDQVEAGLAAVSPKVRVRYELERGRAFNSAGDKARASALFAAAWERAGAAGLDFYAIDAAHMMAIVAPPAVQHDWNLKALALTERTPDPRAKKWLVALYNNIGWTYHDQKDYPAALDVFQKALAAAEARGRPEAVRIAQWTIARCLRSLGRVDEALQRQLALRDDPAATSAGDGYVHEEIGENLLALGRASEARPSFARAHVLLKDDGYLQANEPQRLARLRELGEGR
ncbi:MAG: tetratricopeptide repeat protein [Betaproteobacteria bacterium]|nr:tetratricopeptide repeat protein [Betaproteobacteria bacterium]